MELKNVYHIPRMKNLILMSQLTSSSSGNYVIFGPQDMKVYNRFEPLCELLMEERKLESVYAMTAQKSNVDKT